jgi:hypothetical protein
MPSKKVDECNTMQKSSYKLPEKRRKRIARTLRKECSLNFDVDEKFKSWLAGLIDGEGNFYISPKKIGKPQRQTIRIVLTEKDKFVLDYIYLNVGGKLIYRKPQKSWKPHWKPQWEWQISNYNDCLEFTEWMISDLVLKKGNAMKFLRELEKVY